MAARRQTNKLEIVSGSGHMENKESICLCEGCVASKLNCAVAFIESWNEQSEGVPKFRLKEMEDEHIFRVAIKLRSQLAVDLGISKRQASLGLLH
jgi:hypothetical protein